MSVAQTIIQQLGGRVFVKSVGATSLSGGTNSVSFRLPSNLTKDRISAVIITLNGRDYYNIKAVKMKKFELVTVDEKHDIDAEMLVEVFERMTGLRCNPLGV